MNFSKYKNIKALSIAAGMMLVSSGSLLFSGCKREFLAPDPLSFYEPTATFSTESGLQSALATSDRHLRSYWTNTAANSNSVVCRLSA